MTMVVVVCSGTSYSRGMLLAAVWSSKVATELPLQCVDRKWWATDLAWCVCARARVCRERVALEVSQIRRGRGGRCVGCVGAALRAAVSEPHPLTQY